MYKNRTAYQYHCWSDDINKTTNIELNKIFLGVYTNSLQKAVNSNVFYCVLCLWPGYIKCYSV